MIQSMTVNVRFLEDVESNKDAHQLKSILLMEEILHQLKLVVYPIIHPWWLAGLLNHQQCIEYFHVWAKTCVRLPSLKLTNHT